MKFFVISTGFVIYLVIIYSMNTYFYDSFDTLEDEEELLHYKRGSKYFAGVEKHQRNSKKFASLKQWWLKSNLRFMDR